MCLPAANDREGAAVASSGGVRAVPFRPPRRLRQARSACNNHNVCAVCQPRAAEILVGIFRAGCPGFARAVESTPQARPRCSPSGQHSSEESGAAGIGGGTRGPRAWAGARLHGAGAFCGPEPPHCPHQPLIAPTLQCFRQRPLLGQATPPAGRQEEEEEEALARLRDIISARECL